MVQSEQFYCDMTTDGGGWVLIGRGRDGWSFTTNGQGATREVAVTVNGTAAFAPKALSATFVDELLNNASVTSLVDGVRIRRATNAAGTNYCPVRQRLRA